MKVDVGTESGYGGTWRDVVGESILVIREEADGVEELLCVPL